jgi:DNA-binding MarR family transcriptional regulator
MEIRKKPEDIVKELGYLALGTRLKRLGEHLQSQAQVLLDGAGFDLPASHFPLLASLDRLGPLSVGELAEAVGATQPGVTRMLAKLRREGLVRSRQQISDRRVRTIALTQSGQHFVASSKETVWPIIEGAVADACAGPAHSLLRALTALEAALAAQPLDVRAKRVARRNNASA